ncbi:MAG TPA: NADH-quinone oxidoreductase subunit L, partial [Demequina sp.]|nr:NADH-quinone oxidoreductase subunit L [Demequina sp.]
PNRRMFFAYLNLFIAAMLLLVLADSYLLLFVGWEGVGLASYLLIGFWNHKPEYATAANKAFVVNRVGDVGLIIAMGLMFAHFGSVSFADVLGGVDGASTAVLTAIGLMLLLAATGKSAQFPLQSWLGDAMAGPTPVSALIHAATMVTAGVYLIVRSGAIFEAADDARVVVAIVGAITLILGAVIGSAKDDIKKALAASTMSQIGYMMLAAGLGPIGYVFAIFHLVTHGFFKAGLFLGAGSVMHGMSDQTDMRRYGALRTAMVTTWITFGLGWLAILGVPPFSGFWSKDKIIEAAFVGEGWQPWVFGLTALIGAGMTAFYMSRLFFMTFHGKARWTDDQQPHESPLMMTVPMMILAAGSAFLGLFLAVGNRFQDWLEPVTGAHGEQEPVLAVPVLTTLTLLLVAAGVALAYWMYWRNDVPTVAPPPSLMALAARNDMFQDSVNRGVFQIPGTHLTRTLVYADAALVDGAVNKQATGVAAFGEASRRFQSGKVRSYAMLMLLGFLVLASIIVVGG